MKIDKDQYSEKVDALINSFPSWLIKCFFVYIFLVFFVFLGGYYIKYEPSFVTSMTIYNPPLIDKKKKHEIVYIYGVIKLNKEISKNDILNNKVYLLPNKCVNIKDSLRGKIAYYDEKINSYVAIISSNNLKNKLLFNQNTDSIIVDCKIYLKEDNLLSHIFSNTYNKYRSN
ncbi:hypothetical protein [Runella limosa]|uniref:hypothetical protein n=1 Tax=Runella limosa TaxID=370978 RepID=UPI0004179046|nr:hypothetical protein [Runella limosa]